MIEIEAGFDERELAIDILNKQITEPIPELKIEKESWWKFWK
jgi:hypothetical protein